MQQAILRLFHAVQVDRKNLKREPDIEITKRGIKNGYLLDPNIVAHEDLLTLIEKTVAMSGDKANAAFHKSWSVIETASHTDLLIQQILHYLSTYGFEALGIYDEKLVYIPREELDVPTLTDDFPLVYIRAQDKDEILQKIIVLGSGIALAQHTLDDLMEIIAENAYEVDFVKQIKNRELKTRLFDLYDIVPDAPLDYLRYLIKKLTGESLLIKNGHLIEMIKASDSKKMDALLTQAPNTLGKIFYRYKPLFLAMKEISGNKTFFNRLRKAAVNLHEPIGKDYLNCVTEQINQDNLHLDKLQQHLAKASLFRKIRLAYALKFRLHAKDSIVYRIRNGHAWATEFDWPDKCKTLTQQTLDTVITAICIDLQDRVNGKTIYIPNNVYYALPATEKQFVGNLPSASYITVPDDLIVGVHWQNTDKRVDLDLSVLSQSGKFGWDAQYKDNEVLFSGDMTDAPAPKGATELFYLRKCESEIRILMLNYYNYSLGDEVEARILVAHEKPNSFNNNYMVDPNNLILTANINISRRQNVLGLLANVNGENRVYLVNFSLGNAISAGNVKHIQQTREYLLTGTLESLDLSQILRQAGATVIHKRNKDVDLDLSPEHLNKNTILDLFRS